MRKENTLELNEVKVVNGKTVAYHYSFNGKIKKYLLSDSFYVRYDKPVDKIHESILTIPFVTSMTTVSWLTNTEIRVNNLDRDLAESLAKMKNVYSRFYPLMSFQGKIIVNHIKENRFNNRKMGMLFSGGLDSTSLYIQKRPLKPKLFTIFGAVIPVSNRKMIRKIKKAYSSFAEEEGVKVCYIETNVRKVLNEALITVRFGKYLPQSRGHKSWWEAVNHGPILLSMCAPPSVEDTSHIMLASSTPTVPHGSHPSLTSAMKWGDIMAVPGGFEYDRREKVKKVLKPFLSETRLYPPLQLCNFAPVVSDQFNCGSCEKCVRTILELMLAEIDPRKCRFPLIRDFYNNVKKNVVKDIIAPQYWLNFQKEVHTSKAFARAENFVKWMKEKDFTQIRKRSLFDLTLHWFTFLIYSNLPRRIQMESIRRLYYHQYIRTCE
jgi:hypothetical protein